ncbi:hypothetical protein G6F31_012895 [Rhizopus arrhizus]|nr:hypothetical protein G6F31_012895 [Rhizopus arrhizus]
MQLYSYFRSSAAYRVRIALNLKGLSYEYLPVHLLKDGGQQLSEGYRNMNPTALVPTLIDGDAVIGQSLAIIEYLEETHPPAPLLPADAIGRARVRDLALGIACDTHPLNNLRVLKYLKHTLGVDEAAKNAWHTHWGHQGLDALEAQGKYEEADAAAAKAIALGAPNRNDLTARQQTMKRRMAIKPAEAGYQALIANRPGDAVPLARQAVALAPDTASHRLLLISALMLDNQLQAAEDAATDAMKQDDENTVALVMRAYLRQRQGKTDLANADFDAALKQDWLDDDQRRNIRLIAADASLAAGENARALALVQPLGAKDDAADARIKRARARPAVPATLTLANYPAPVQDCRDTPYGTSCELLPSDAAGSGGPASLAYAAYAREDYQEAIAQARKAVEQDPANKELQRLLTTTLAAGNRQQLAEANQRMGEALAAQPDDPTLLMQRGYLHQRMNEPKLALQDFQAARATGKAPPTVILDEGYALKPSTRPTPAGWN